jgi:predicted metal-dependent phosphoesterase TrpH
MKKLIFTLTAAVLAIGASAQHYYTDANNSEMLHIGKPRTAQRTNIDIPQVNGYNVYKADLHTHSIYSDGHASLTMRLAEAWRDGLDIYAVTEHAEYRPHEKDYVKWMKGYLPENIKAENNSLVNKSANEKGILVDLNLPYRLAMKAAEKYGITVIPGIEVTRTPATIGHYNALFIKDANKIYDADPEKAIRNARKQGAIIMHNHPGWTRKNLDMIEFEQRVYDKGLIDGVEIMNGTEFYPKAIDRAKQYKLFMASNTDIHQTTSELYSANDEYRNMTLILAKDKSLESIREALEAKRTLAFSFGTVVGDEELLRALFHASVKITPTQANEKRAYLQFENNSSIDFILRQGEGAASMVLNRHSTILVRCATNAAPQIIVENMWHGAEQKLQIDLTPYLVNENK